MDARCCKGILYQLHLRSEVPNRSVMIFHPHQPFQCKAALPITTMYDEGTGLSEANDARISPASMVGYPKLFLKHNQKLRGAKL